MGAGRMVTPQSGGESFALLKDQSEYGVPIAGSFTQLNTPTK